MHLVLAGKLQSDPYQAHCFSARAWQGVCKSLSPSPVRHCPTPYKARRLFFTVFKYSSCAIICAREKLIIQMSLESKYRKELEHSLKLLFKIAFKLKKLLADDILEYLPYFNDTAHKSFKTGWAKRRFGISIAFQATVSLKYMLPLNAQTIVLWEMSLKAILWCF